MLLGGFTTTQWDGRHKYQDDVKASADVTDNLSNGIPTGMTCPRKTTANYRTKSYSTYEAEVEEFHHGEFVVYHQGLHDSREILSYWFRAKTITFHMVESSSCVTCPRYFNVYGPAHERQSL